jgi:hypothetical protein
MVDAHDTIFKGKYEANQDFDIYPGCLEVLKWISDRNDQVLILWTSSYREHIDEIVSYFRDKHGIHIDYVNKNPICADTAYGSFIKKFYFNIGLDDKFGFEGETDWFLVKEELIRIGEWDSQTFPKMIFYTKRGTYNYIPEDSSREAYDTLVGYVGAGKVTPFYENWKEVVEQRNRKNKEIDGTENLTVESTAVLNSDDEKEKIKQIEKSDGFVSWLVNTEIEKSQ